MCVGSSWQCEYDSTGCDEEPEEPNPEPKPGDDCQQHTSSTLPGVDVRFTGARCAWTLEEVAQGIELPYVIDIDEAHELRPTSLSSCPRPGPSGLMIFEEIRGPDDHRSLAFGCPFLQVGEETRSAKRYTGVRCASIYC